MSGSVKQAVVVRLGQLAALALVQAALLFVAAGRTDWVAAWVYFASYLALIGANAALLLRRDPELVAERTRVVADAKGWDKVLVALLSLSAFATLVVAGLDRRFRWTPALGWLIPGMGYLLFLSGSALVSWAMACNRFFSSVARIQHDRGHVVAEGGPYGFVRHPGYLGMMSSMAGVPLLLGSLWALIGTACYVVTLVVRTVLEDRMLREELPGYSEYASRVRRRLLPGAW